MTTFSLLGKKEIKITDRITVRIPLVSEMRECFNEEGGVFKLITVFINTPCDVMVELDDIGVDYTETTEYELFICAFDNFLNGDLPIEEKYWSMLFPYLDKNTLSVKDNAVVDNENNVIIDERIYNLIADLFRQILDSPKNMEYYNVPEVETRKYIISRQRAKMQREALKKTDNYLDNIIFKVVNDPSNEYDLETVNDLTIYDLVFYGKQIKNKTL